MRKFIDIDFNSSIGIAFSNFLDYHNRYVRDVYATTCPIPPNRWNKLRKSWLKRNYNCHYIRKQCSDLDAKFSLIFETDEDVTIFLIKWS